MNVTLSKGESIVGAKRVTYLSSSNRGEIVVGVEGQFTHVNRNGRERILNQMKTATVVSKIIDNRQS